MKFYCDACNTKYAISDDKVRGKVLKVRCKNCGNIITVREHAEPAAAMPQPSAPAVSTRQVNTAVPQNNWHYAVNGRTFGPFVLDRLTSMYATGEIGDETYVWHDTMDSWKPVGQVSVFADALSRGQAVQPRSKTLGYTGPIQAIQAPAGVNRARDGIVPAQQARTPEQKPHAPAADPRSEKLAKLRERLLEDAAAPAASAPTSQIPLPQNHQQTPFEAPPKPSAHPLGPPPGGDFEDAPTEIGVSTHGLSFAAGVPHSQKDASGPFSSGLGTSPAPLGAPPASSVAPLTPSPVTPNPFAAPEPDAINFDIPTSAPEMPTSSRSDILDHHPELQQPTADPFFPEAPKLGGDPSVSQQIPTGSLLIRIGEMKKKQRRKQLMVAGVSTVLIVALASTAAFLYLNREKKDDTVAVVEQPKQKDELVIKTYSKDDNLKITELELGEEVIDFTEEEVDDVEVDDSDPNPRPVVKNGGSKPSDKAGKRPKKGTKKPTEVAAVETKPQLTNDPLAYRASGSATTINRPKDDLLSGANKTELSKDDARRGFKRVRKSIVQCHARHTKRGQPLEAKKIFVTVEVAGSGKVNTFRVKPKSIRESVFERCMQSHKDRWRFASFRGPAVKIQSRFILQ